MLELIPVHNLYWKKYLTFGYHELITLWMDEYGLPIYRDVVSIIHQGMVFQKLYSDLIKIRYVMLIKQNINQYLENV